MNTGKRVHSTDETQMGRDIHIRFQDSLSSKKLTMILKRVTWTDLIILVKMFSFIHKMYFISTYKLHSMIINHLNILREYLTSGFV